MSVIDDIYLSIVQALKPSVNDVRFSQISPLTIGFYSLDDIVGRLAQTHSTVGLKLTNALLFVRIIQKNG